MGLKLMWKLCLLGIIIISCFPITSDATDITLQWDANTEPDLEGYIVYYKTGSSGEPYEYADTVSVAELDDPDMPWHILTGLDYDEDYFIAVTAYDSKGIESDYSNEVSANISSPQRDEGGGGCFIGASR